MGWGDERRAWLLDSDIFGPSLKCELEHTTEEENDSDDEVGEEWGGRGEE